MYLDAAWSVFNAKRQWYFCWGARVEEVKSWAWR